MVTVLINAIAIGVVLLYGCLGEMLMEKSGHLNLGVPGIMCMGAVGGCFGLNLYLGGLETVEEASWILLILVSLLFSILFSVATGAIYTFLTVTLRCNQNITGLAVTTFGSGLAQFIYDVFVKKGNGYPFFRNASFMLSRGFVADDPENTNWFLRLFFSHGFFVYFAIALAVVFALILKYTRVGLHLRAVGESPAAADAAGVNVTAYKYCATLIGSAVAGFGGLFYLINSSKGGLENTLTIQKFGWLAIALVIFALWRPALSILGSIVFGWLYVAGSYVPIPNFLSSIIPNNIQKPLLKLLPYVITVAVLIFISIRNKRENQPPASLGLSYFREER